MNKIPTLAIVIPCLNEEVLLESTISRLLSYLDELNAKGKVTKNSFIYLVDDGSTDSTWEILSRVHSEKPAKVKGLKLTKNFGNQNAILAGLVNSKKYKPDCVLTIDADLQQDEKSIERFIEKFTSGADIVFGIRKDRKTDSFFKKFTALTFYKFMNLLGANIIFNHSDYRLISARVLDTISEFKETNIFLRCMLNDIGYNKEYVYFDVKGREGGKSRYTFKKLLALAFNGITSYSVVPLRLVALTGLIMALLSLGFVIEVLYERYFINDTIPGWTTVVIAITFIGGVQIFCTGIIGEYLGQIYKEVKARPIYIKDEELE